MKEKILFGATVLLAGSLLAVDSNPQDAVKDAAKSLGEKSNYSWTTTIDLGGDMSGTIEGKAEKAGATFLVLSAALPAPSGTSTKRLPFSKRTRRSGRIRTCRRSRMRPTASRIRRPRPSRSAASRC